MSIPDDGRKYLKAPQQSVWFRTETLLYWNVLGK